MSDLPAAKAALRAAIPKVAPSEADAAALAVHVLALPEMESARTVAGFVSMGAEPDTAPLLAALRAGGLRVLVPVVSGPDLLWEVLGTPGAFGELADADVVLVPGVAFDETGARLGRGGGHYDRALAASTGLTVGLCTEAALVAAVPTEAHDVRMNVVVTPACARRWTPPGA